jgi:hypothetical protein
MKKIKQEWIWILLKKYEEDVYCKRMKEMNRNW